MEFLIELLVSVVFEGIAEAAFSPKLTPWVRYPAIVLIFGGLGLLGVAGIAMIVAGDSVFYICGGLLILWLDVFLILKGSQKIKKVRCQQQGQPKES